jgi:predicted signal transduction protein with EAL and GGDEF domain
VRRIWQLLATALGIYATGNLLNAAYWMAVARRGGLFDNAVALGLPYAAMPTSFVVLVYFTRGATSDPAVVMTIIIFVLTMLVMLRQGVILHDDAALRERRAAGLVEARYASLIRNASDVIMIADPDGRLRFVSPAAERTFARHPDELVGRNLQDHPAIGGFALSFHDVSERKALEEQLRQLAFHDPLTLLANRSLFRNRVEHALALGCAAGQGFLFAPSASLESLTDSPWAARRAELGRGHDTTMRLTATGRHRLARRA